MLGQSQEKRMLHNSVQTEDSDQSCQMTDHSLIRLNVELLDGVDWLGGSHVVRVVGSHSDEVELELLVELLPVGVDIVFFIWEELKTTADAVQSIPFQ